jgi:hypothetical protein
MNQSQFRGLLIVYAVGWLILAAHSFYYGLLLAEETLMANEAPQPQAGSAWESVLWFLGGGLVGFGGTMLAVVAWLGLFVFWKPARVLYAVYLALVYVLVPLVGGVLLSSGEVDVTTSVVSPLQMPWLQALRSIISLLEGAILVVVFSGVGAHLFEKTRIATD